MTLFMEYTAALLQGDKEGLAPVALIQTEDNPVAMLLIDRSRKH